MIAHRRLLQSTRHNTLSLGRVVALPSAAIHHSSTLTHPAQVYGAGANGGGQLGLGVATATEHRPAACRDHKDPQLPYGFIELLESKQLWIHFDSSNSSSFFDCSKAGDIQLPPPFMNPARLMTRGTAGLVLSLQWSARTATWPTPGTWPRTAGTAVPFFSHSVPFVAVLLPFFSETVPLPTYTAVAGPPSRRLREPGTL